MRLKDYFFVDFFPDSLIVLAAWDFSCFDDFGSRISLDACDFDIFLSIVLMFSRCNSINDLHKKLFADFVSGCILYTSAKPCPMCLSAIYWSNIQIVYYGNTRTDTEWAGFSDQFILDELQKPIDQQKIKFERASAPAKP